MRIRVLWALGLAGCAVGGGGDGAQQDTDVPSGTAPLVIEDVPVQVFTHTVAPLDLLLIIDDSCSMSEEQLALSRSAGSLVAILEYLAPDWRLGVVSTDMDTQAKAGVLIERGGHHFIDSQTANPIDLADAMIRLGTSGSATEKGRAAGFLAVNQQEANDNFRRTDANLAMVVLSDEDDQSGLDPTLSEFIQWLGEQRGGSFSSIVTPRGGCQPGGFSEGLQYIEVSKALGGAIGSICQSEYDDDLYRAVVAAQTPRFRLWEPVDPATIEVFALTDNQPGVPLDRSEWRFRAASSSVELAFTPESGAQFAIRYELLPTE